jgi:hypothetical protein
MNVLPKEPSVESGSLLEEILDAVLAEPAAAWLIAQAVWVAQPALEAFWPREKIQTFADLLESASGSDGSPARGGKGA